ncbi:MAG TPA: NlpC/P60 family protein [Bacillales bacterium]|nr:NlpC/P60 family protein [Bacillales bacterium]
MGKRRIVSTALGVCLAASIAGVHSASADTGSELRIQRLHIKESQQELHNIEQKKAAAIEKLTKLQDDIDEAEQQIEATLREREETQEEINRLKTEIAETQKRINHRENLLKGRVREMYKSGGAVSYLDVLLQSQDFSQLLSRVFAFTLITNQDHKLLAAQEKDMEQLQTSKEKIVQKLNDLQEQMDELKSLQSELEAKKEAQQEIVEDLKEQGIELRNTIASGKAKIRSLKLALYGGSSSNDNNDSGNGGSHHSSSVDTDVDIPEPVPGGTVQDLVQAASRYFGNSIYVFGGGRSQADIANGVFDCSGFVHWAYAQIGVNVGWSTSSLSHQGTRVPYSQIRPGDMVFFNTYKRDGHVGIYIGGGRFIGSQSSTGVAIASMSNPYWSSHFSGHVQRVLH